MTTIDEAREIAEKWARDYGCFDYGSEGHRAAVADLASRVARVISKRELKLDAIAEILKDK